MDETITEQDEAEATETPEPDEPTPDGGQDDDQDEPDTETSDDPEQTPPPSDPEEFEEAQKKLARSATSWRNSVSRIMGEDAQHLAPCPLCPDNLPGFVFPDAIPEEHRASVIEWLRGADVPELSQDPDTQVCDVCGGHGETLTGSPVPGKITKLCGKCSGNGFTTRQDEESWRMMHPPAQPQQFTPTTPAAAATTTPPLPATDNMGRPYGSEFYGRDPQFMSAEERQRDPYVVA